MDDAAEVTDDMIVDSDDESCDPKTVRMSVIDMIERYPAVKDYFAGGDDVR